MTYRLISLSPGDRTIMSDDKTPHCCFCLKEIKTGQSCYFCKVNKNIYCTNKECKGTTCKGLASLQDEHEDIFGTLKKEAKQ